jgi:hypothetical protein
VIIIPNQTTIAIDENIRDDLRKLGIKGEKYNEIIKNLVNLHSSKRAIDLRLLKSYIWKSLVKESVDKGIELDELIANILCEYVEDVLGVKEDARQ